MKSLLSVLLIITVLAFDEGLAQGQQSAKVPRVGLLVTGSPSGRGPNNREAFLRGLRELGYVEGDNIIIERRHTKGKRHLLPEIAAELVRLKVSVIVVAGPTAIRQVIKATKTIPIVMVSAGPVVSQGFVKSHAYPGGNVTGLSSYVKGIHGKRLELLRDTFPSISHVAVLSPRRRRRTPKEYRQAAKGLGLQLQFAFVRNPEDVKTAFQKIAGTRPDALITIRNHLTNRFAKEIAEFAVKQRIPSMYHSAYFVRVGGLMSYGMNYRRMWHRAAVYVDKILKGANPATLPVEPPQLELIINLKTARKIAVKIPPEILLEANQVIK